jgi:uncharacterized RDD family membrane protein YckC
MTDASSPTIAVRLASMIYETLLLAGVIAVGFLLPHILFGVAFERSAPVFFQRAHFVLLLMAYFVWFWLNGGQTLAMKTWRLKLVSTRPAPLTPPQAALRFFWAWPSLLLAGAGIFWALFNADRQFFHDQMAGTRLVRLPKPAKT